MTGIAAGGAGVGCGYGEKGKKQSVVFCLERSEMDDPKIEPCTHHYADALFREGKTGESRTKSSESGKLSGVWLAGMGE